jgi:predicted nuclease with RNAse H fold
VKTTRVGPVPPYIGADLTDRYAKGCRPNDVCGLTPTRRGTLQATFWEWHWDPAPQPLDSRPIVAELAQARCSMLDGPQGLARPGRSMRECDRVARAAGRVPQRRPDLDRPFGGFICSSLDLFAALKKAKLEVGEAYPGAIWTRLAKTKLESKKTERGRASRVKLDQLDAAIAAVTAAAAAGAIDGLAVESVGDPLRSDKGVLREGTMTFPAFRGQALRRKLARQSPRAR